MKGRAPSEKKLALEIERLRAELGDALDALRAQRTGEVDSVFVPTDASDPRLVPLGGAANSYRVLIEEMADAAVILTAGGDVVFCNARLASMLGLPLAKVLGHSLEQYLELPAGTTLATVLERARSGAAYVKASLRRAGGGSTAVQLSVTSFLMQEVRAGCIVIRDLTLEKRRDEDARLLGVAQAERAQAEASEQWWRLLANAIPQIVWTTDGQGTLDFLNKRWVEYSGLSLDESVGTGWERALHVDDVLHWKEWWRACVGVSAGLDLEYRVRRADGEYRWHLARTLSIPGPEGTIHKRVGTATDIHVQKIAERDAQHANRTKDEFLAMVSHELRTPLQSMLGWIHLLRRGIPDEAKRTRALDTVERNARVQVRLIEDLLDVSRVITGKLHLRMGEVDLEKTVDAALEAVKPAVNVKSITVERHLDPELTPIPGDAVRLQQVLWNLLANALKFTPAGGTVRVRVERLGREVKIAVSDTGEGIAPEFLPHMFERFRQAKGSTTRTHGGLGLGLAIVAHIVQLHGGTISTESPGIGLGSTFTVVLPGRAKSARDSALLKAFVPEAPGSTPKSPLERMKILVVDDEPDVRELVATFLESYGADVIAVPSVATALDALGRFSPDVLISDLSMPEEDGFSLIRKVRKLDARRPSRLPAIAFTALARSEDRTRAIAAGFDAHASKPIQPEELVELIVRVVRRMATQPGQ